MAGICSRHQGNDPDCAACQAEPRDLFPDWDEKLAEAEAAGRIHCPECGYEFYLTTRDCPLCGEGLPEGVGDPQTPKGP